MIGYFLFTVPSRGCFNYSIAPNSSILTSSTNAFLGLYKQQQTSNMDHAFREVLRDSDVTDLTSTYRTAYKEIVSNIPTVSYTHLTLPTNREV